MRPECSVFYDNSISAFILGLSDQAIFRLAIRGGKNGTPGSTQRDRPYYGGKTTQPPASLHHGTTVLFAADRADKCGGLE
jgi:hypothetical protein